MITSDVSSHVHNDHTTDAPHTEEQQNNSSDTPQFVSKHKGGFLQKNRVKLVALGVVFFLILAGTVSVLTLSKTSQDLRQQASVLYPSPPPSPAACNQLCALNSDCATGYCHTITANIRVCKKQACPNDPDCVCPPPSPTPSPTPSPSPINCSGLPVCPSSMTKVPINSCTATCATGSSRCNVNGNPFCASFNTGMGDTTGSWACPGLAGYGSGTVHYNYLGAMDGISYTVKTCSTSPSNSSCSNYQIVYQGQNESYTTSIGVSEKKFISIYATGLGLTTNAVTMQFTCPYSAIEEEEL